MIGSISNDRLLVVTESKLILVAAKILDLFPKARVLALVSI